MSAERERSQMRALDSLEYSVIPELEEALMELHDAIFGMNRDVLARLNKTFGKFGYKVVKKNGQSKR